MTAGLRAFQQQNSLFSSAAEMSATHDPTGDLAFMEAVHRAINNRLGELAIRAMWTDWIGRFTRMAAVFEETIYGASALYIGGDVADAGAYGVAGHGYVWTDDAARTRELAGNAHRIEGWRNTRSYYSLIQDVAHLYTSRPISTLDLQHHHDRLRTQRLGPDASAAVYIAFARAVHTHAEICQLLTVTSEAHGGLFYLSLGLLHPRVDVRRDVVGLLERVMRHDAGKHFWERLGRFAKIAFARIRADMSRSAPAAQAGTAEGSRAPSHGDTSVVLDS